MFSKNFVLDKFPPYTGNGIHAFLLLKIEHALYLLSSSVLCAPFLTITSSFICSGIDLSNFVLIHRPINVANEQCGTVGLNSTFSKVAFVEINRST